MVVAKVINALRKKIIPSEVQCKGLLLVRKSSMFLFTIKVCLSQLGSGELNVEYSSVKSSRFDNKLTLAFVCAGIQKLI